MKFGKVKAGDIVDLALPPIPVHTERFLAKLPKTLPTKLFVGGTQWTQKQWLGKWMPAGLKAEAHLMHYANMFNTIELNATFYRTPDLPTVEEWCSQVPDDFRFCPKWPQAITHYRRFKNCEKQSDAFIESANAFGAKLGRCFIQLPSNFTVSHVDNLTNYLKMLPHDLPLAIEFRHASWFSGDAVVDSLYSLMEERNIATCLSDTLGRRDALSMRITSSALLLRFGGNALHESDSVRLKEWADVLETWAEKGVNKIYFFIHQPDSILTPETAQVLLANFESSRMSIPSAPQEIQNLFG
jgi:uncharacterized protein YecE (DUF72 family)